MVRLKQDQKRGDPKTMKDTTAKKDKEEEGRTIGQKDRQKIELMKEDIQ